MKILLVYIHIPEDEPHHALAARFIGTYHHFPPGEEHQTLVVCNYAPANALTQALFACLPNVTFLNRHDEGWDIGAYLQVARMNPDCDFMVCFGSSAHFNRADWLRRMRLVWEGEGPGLYGPFGSFEVRPHLRTIGFWCRPKLLAIWPGNVTNHAERYAFEHGDFNLTNHAEKHLCKVRMVTWDGAWKQEAWRYPTNIFRRGDQTNCLIWDRHTEMFAGASAADRQTLARAAG